MLHWAKLTTPTAIPIEYVFSAVVSSVKPISAGRGREGGREGRGEGGEGRRGEERDVSSVNRIPCVCVCVLTGDGGRDENEETERCQVGQFPV